MNADSKVAVLRMRLRADDTKYASGVIPAASYMGLMADAGAMLGIVGGGTAGYLARWEEVDFSAVCNVGDFIEVRAEKVSRGNRSRRIRSEVVRLIRTGTGEVGQTTRGEVLDPPEIVASGVYVGVVPKRDVEE